MNRFDGVRYCGKRGSTSLLDMKRPIIADKTASELKYVCPDGYKAICNPEFLNISKGANYAICTKIEAGIDDDLCPITSFKFNVTDEERETEKYVFKKAEGSSSKGIWISRKVMQHGIESVKVMPE